MYLYKTDFNVALLNAYLSSLMWLMGEWLVQGVWGHRCSMVRKTSWRASAVLNRHPLVTKTPLAIYPQRFTIGFGSGEHAGCSKNITLFSWKRFLHQVKGPISTKDGGLHSWGIPAQMRPRVHISARCLMPLHELSLHCSTEVKKKHLAWGRDQPLVFTGGFYGCTFLSTFIQDPERPISTAAWTILPHSMYFCSCFFLYLHFAPVFTTCLWSTHVEGLSMVCKFCSINRLMSTLGSCCFYVSHGSVFPDSVYHVSRVMTLATPPHRGKAGYQTC